MKGKISVARRFAPKPAHSPAPFTYGITSSIARSFVLHTSKIAYCSPKQIGCAYKNIIYLKQKITAFIFFTYKA